MNNIKQGGIKKKAILITAFTAAAGVVIFILLMHAFIFGRILYPAGAAADKTFRKSFKNGAEIYFRKVANDLDSMRKDGKYEYLSIIDYKGTLIGNAGNSGYDVFPEWENLRKEFNFGKDFSVSHVTADDKKVLFDFNGNYAVIYSLDGQEPPLPDVPGYENAKRKAKVGNGWYYYRIL